jgi:G3E family GTPase
MTPTPVTIITGFLGSGKTTLILNLIPQLPKTYRVCLSVPQIITELTCAAPQLALLKNEFGDLAVDSQLASSASISGVRELLNGCICCNLVGQLGPALLELRSLTSPDRIIIETSGSAFPATLAMEVNRLIREQPGCFVLDGVISVIDVENWKGYDDTSVTAKMQARYTDLIVFNKWELVDESRFDECLDRVGDLELQTAWVRSRRGWVDQAVVMGIDGSLIGKEGVDVAAEINKESQGPGGHGHHHEHQEEVEVLSVVLESEALGSAAVDMDAFEDLLLSAPKDEVYRIKGLLMSSIPPSDSTGERRASTVQIAALYVLNWAFGRWTYTALLESGSAAMKGAAARLTFILARGEAMKWKKKLEGNNLLMLEGKVGGGKVSVEKAG